MPRRGRSPRDEAGERARLQLCVLTYLVAHPEAKDSLEGIVQWWLPGASARWRRDQVAAALEELVARGWLVAAWQARGTPVYGLSAPRLEEITAFLERTPAATARGGGGATGALAGAGVLPPRPAEMAGRRRALDVLSPKESAMANLSWSITLQVTGGPTVNSGQSGLDIEAVDRVDVTIAGGDTDKVVQIQPGAANHVHLLVVTSDLYGPTLRFKASDGTTDSAEVVLDAPQVYAGGAAALFATDPKQLKLSNAGVDPAHVTVFVARDAKV